MSKYELKNRVRSVSKVRLSIEKNLYLFVQLVRVSLPMDVGDLSNHVNLCVSLFCVCLVFLSESLSPRHNRGVNEFIDKEDKIIIFNN